MSKEKWDVEETDGFVSVKAWDNLYYKVWNVGTPETIQKVADILANVRYDINKLLIYLCKNKKNWENHPIAFGIYHTFDLHANGSNENVFNDINANSIINKMANQKIFNYQEMTPNNLGLLGLNKPKEVTNINVTIDGKKIKYEIASKRSIFLTIRPNIKNKPNYIENYQKIMDLAIHELTHTTCNDTRWKDDNHKHPYPVYHKMMRKFASICDIIK